MTFDIEAVRERTPVARVVIAATRGSTPREVGAAMLVTGTDVVGTIGGGALELQAIEEAREALATGHDQFRIVALGPGLGQCCGGSVSLLTEVWDADRLDRIGDALVARPLPGGATDMPLAVARALAEHRSKGLCPPPGIFDDWMIEPVSHPAREIWIWGAGHVGRALVDTLAPLPDLKLVWIDSAMNRFPAEIPKNVSPLAAKNPADMARFAPAGAEHLVLTYSHAFDLEICHQMLSRDFARLGLIGSATKKARFRKRLAALGHTPSALARLECPIGDPRLGKHPQAIAIGVANDILRADLGGLQMIGAQA